MAFNWHSTYVDWTTNNDILVYIWEKRVTSSWSTTARKTWIHKSRISGKIRRNNKSRFLIIRKIETPPLNLSGSPFPAMNPFHGCCECWLTTLSCYFLHFTTPYPDLGQWVIEIFWLNESIMLGKVTFFVSSSMCKYLSYLLPRCHYDTSTITRFYKLFIFFVIKMIQIFQKIELISKHII